MSEPRDLLSVSARAISLRIARICLDCDLLIASTVCPACGLDQTIPIAGWLPPLYPPVGNDAHQAPV